MKHRKRSLIIISILILIAGVATDLWIEVPAWLPFVIRNRDYRQLIGDFQRAKTSDKKTPGAGWDFQLQVPGSQTTARVHAAEHNSVVKIKFADEDKERELYSYMDYTHPKEIRTAENILYVRWVEILFRTNYWILAYDMDSRREIMRRRIDMADLTQSR